MTRMKFAAALCFALIAWPPGTQLIAQENSASPAMAAQLESEFASAQPADYDPLKCADSEGEEIEQLKLVVKDGSRDREIPLLVYLPADDKPTAVILHSHGLGGTRGTSPFLGKHWAGRGFLAVFLQHPGSDNSVWQDVPRSQRMQAMRQAASGENLLLRTGDVRAVIDQLEKWNDAETHPLKNRMDLAHIGMSGHSFGAVTTQHVSGQATFGMQASIDKRIKAAIPMSPSAPRNGDPAKAFGRVDIPWLCMTGTKDISPIGGADLDSRLSVFPALPAADKYELVLSEAEHSVFTETSLRRSANNRNPNHHRAIKAITTAFWDSYLRDDEDAKQWLRSDSIRNVLEAEDRWRKK